DGVDRENAIAGGERWLGGGKAADRLTMSWSADSGRSRLGNVLVRLPARRQTPSDLVGHRWSRRSKAARTSAVLSRPGFLGSFAGASPRSEALVRPGCSSAPRRVR